MVSEKKKTAVKELTEELKKYPVIGMLDMFKLPARQLQEMREQLRGKAVIKVIRKNIAKLAIEKAGLSGLKELEDVIQNQPALLLSETNPFRLARIIDSSKSPAPAKAGDIAPKDITVKEGPTSLPPGPVIGELQRVKIPAGVDGDKIVIKKDSVVVKEGEEISKPLADILMKLGIEPMEISLNLLAVWENGIIYPKTLLSVPLEEYKNSLISVYRDAFNLCISIGFITKDTAPVLISKAHNEALSLSLEADLITKETLPMLLSKANSQMLAVSSKLPQDSEGEEGKPTEEIPKECKKEQKPEGSLEEKEGSGSEEDDADKKSEEKEEG